MDPDQPAHPRSLIRIHAVRLTDNNSMDFMLVANPLCWFCRDAAHLFLPFVADSFQKDTLVKNT
jgi:hypothetical protein